MLLNQINTKDLFSTNPGSILGNKYDFSDSAINSSTQSNSQLLNSQLEYSQISSGDGYSQQMSNLSQSVNSGSYYQRYMAKGPLFGPKENQSDNSQSQESLSHHGKNSFQEQLKINKQRIKEKEERDLLYSIINAVKECENEVKESVSEIKAIVNQASSSDKKNLKDYLEKLQETLYRQQEELCSMLKTRDDDRSKITSLEKQLAVKDSLLNELKDKVVELDNMRTDRIVKELKKAYTDQQNLIIGEISQMTNEQKKHSDSIFEKHTALLGQQTSYHKTESGKQQSHLDSINQQLQQRLSQVDSDNHAEHVELKEYWRSQLEMLQCQQRQELQNTVLTQVEKIQKNQNSLQMQMLRDLHVKHKQEVAELITRQLKTQDLHSGSSERQPGYLSERTSTYHDVDQQFQKHISLQNQFNSDYLLSDLILDHRKDVQELELVCTGGRKQVDNSVYGHAPSYNVQDQSQFAYDSRYDSSQRANVDMNLPHLKVVDKWTTFGTSRKLAADYDMLVSQLPDDQSTCRDDDVKLVSDHAPALTNSQHESGTLKSNMNHPVIQKETSDSCVKYSVHAQSQRPQSRNSHVLRSPTPLLSPNMHETLYTTKSLFSKTANPSPVATVLPQVQRVLPVQNKNDKRHSECVYDIENLDAEFDEQAQQPNHANEPIENNLMGIKRMTRKNKNMIPVPLPKRSNPSEIKDVSTFSTKNAKNMSKRVSSPRRSDRLAGSEGRSLRSGTKLIQENANNKQKVPAVVKSKAAKIGRARKGVESRSESPKPINDNSKSFEQKARNRFHTKRSNSHLDLTRIPATNSSLRRCGSVQELSQYPSKGSQFAAEREDSEDEESSPVSSVTKVVIKRRTKKLVDNTFATPEVNVDIPVVNTAVEIESARMTNNIMYRRDLKKRKLCEDGITSSQLWAILKTSKIDTQD